MKINPALKIGIVSSVSLISVVALGIWLYQNHLNNTHKRYYPLNLRNLQSLSRQLNVKLTVITEPISIKSGKHQISLKSADIEYLNFYIPKFIAELSKYPSETISEIGLKEVMIGRSLYLDEHACGGMQSKYLDMLFFNCEFVNSDQWTRQTIHHEMFHLIDWKDGTVKHDAEWEKLNPSEFSYGSGGWSVHKSDLSAALLDSSLSGFLNRYSMSGVEEDKAEIFAHMMANYKAIDSKAETDPIIKAKMSQMKKLLYDFCPAFNEVFWSKIKAAPVPSA